MVQLPDELDERQFSGNGEAFKGLIQELSSGNLIAVVGAGASAPMLPTWAGVLSLLLSEAAAKGFLTPEDEEWLNSIRTKAPLDVASSLESAFTREPFRARLGELFHSNGKLCTTTHELITSLGFLGYITSNYDDGLEVAISKQMGVVPQSDHYGNRYALQRWKQRSIFSSDNVPILHLHGSAADTGTMIFTADDYHKVYIDQGLLEFVSELFVSHKVVLLGFGFADPFLTFAMEKTLRTASAGALHYAFVGVPKGEKITPLMRRTFLNKYRLTPIYYPIVQSEDTSGRVAEDHSALEKMLKAALDLREKRPSMMSEAAVQPSSDSSELAIPLDVNVAQNYEWQLFQTPLGKPLYVEPILRDAPKQNGLSQDEAAPIPVLIETIVESEENFAIISQPEAGASVLCKRLEKLINAKGSQLALYRDASQLPNYRKKLEKEFEKLDRSRTNVLVLDNFMMHRDERLIREVIGLDIFKRIILGRRLIMA